MAAHMGLTRLGTPAEDSGRIAQTLAIDGHWRGTVCATDVLLTLQGMPRLKSKPFGHYSAVATIGFAYKPRPS